MAGGQHLVWKEHGKEAKLGAVEIWERRGAGKSGQRGWSTVDGGAGKGGGVPNKVRSAREERGGGAREVLCLFEAQTRVSKTPNHGRTFLALLDTSRDVCEEVGEGNSSSLDASQDACEGVGEARRERRTQQNIY